MFADEMPPREGCIRPETLVLASVRFRQRCHLRRRCHYVLGLLLWIKPPLGTDGGMAPPVSTRISARRKRVGNAVHP